MLNKHSLNSCTWQCCN